MKLLIIKSFILMSLLAGCGSEVLIEGKTTTYNTEEDLFAYWSGVENLGTPIGFNPQPYASLPIKVYREESHIHVEDYEKAFRFWNYIADRELFVLTDELLNPICTNTTAQGDCTVHSIMRGIIVKQVDLEDHSCASRGGWGILKLWKPDCTIYTGGFVEAWYTIAHELGHAIGLGHGGVDNCIMKGPASGVGCDLRIIKTFYE